MVTPKSRIIDGIKFMWDGKDYETADDAEKMKAEYEQQGFEARVVEAGEKFEVYTRRVVTDVQVEAPTLQSVFLHLTGRELRE